MSQSNSVASMSPGTPLVISKSLNSRHTFHRESYVLQYYMKLLKTIFKKASCNTVNWEWRVCLSVKRMTRIEWLGEVFPVMYWLTSWTVTLEEASSNSSCSITFTFGLMPLGKGMNPLIPPSYGINSTTTVLLRWWLWHWITHQGSYAIKNKKSKQLIHLIKKFLKSCLSRNVNWWNVFGNYQGMLRSNTPQNSSFTVTYLSSHKLSKMIKIGGALLEKQGRTHKRRSFLDSNIWSQQCWPTNKYLHR